MDKKLTQTLASIHALKAGKKVYAGHGNRLFDVSRQTLWHLQHDTIARLKWELHLYETHTVRYRFGDNQADTTDEIIASIADELAQIQATL